ncbi:MAG: ABC-type transport auxiliary lipoprotein family protein [Azoarcus sp.]|jgi:cholesterol transport system auxiliary component|nr:ABC-type transport auxiliary lipoprotein family protein [Azoarcus sp.]
MIRHRACRVALSALCVLLSAACSILPAPRPVDVYLLPAPVPKTADGDGVPRSWSLRIARPETGGQLLGQRILVIPEQNRVSVYEGANWHEPAPLLMRNRLFDAFRMDGRISALSTDEMRAFADLELLSDLNTFHSEYRQDDASLPDAVIRLDVRLVDTASRRIVASRVFERRAAAAASAVPAVVAAFGAAADRLAAELVAWTVAQGDAAQNTAHPVPVTPLRGDDGRASQ